MTREPAQPRRRLPRFSLRSLILLVALAGSGYGLWARWEPWVRGPVLKGHPGAVYTAKFSPDGRYVAYVSDESGEYDVYVRPFPPGGGQWQLSFDGGVQPQWRGDGKELFYVSGNTLLAVAVNTEPTFSLGRTSRLFESPGFRISQWSPRYDVSADGQQIVVREPLVEGVQSTIRVVQNWYEEFRDREQD